MTDGEYTSCVDLYADAVFRFMMKNLGNKADAEDLVQVTFEKVWMNREKVDFESAKSYLFKVAYNSMIDLIRKNKKVSLPGELNNSQSEEMKKSFELKEVINKALETLSQVQKSVVMLRDYEGYSYAEIAELMKLSESQVKVYIYRARKKMKQYIVQLDNVL